MKRALFAAALVVTVAGCGGGGGGGGGASFRDPDAVTFTYGTPAPAATVEEQDAVAAAESSVVDALYFVEDTDPASAYSSSGGLAGAPSEIGGLFAGGSFGLLREPGGVPSVRALLQGGGAGLVEEPGFTDPDCWSLTATELRFDRCTITETDTEGTLSSTIDGALHREPGRVYWDVTLSMRLDAVDEGVSMSLRYSDHRTGDIAYTDTTFAGFARADVQISASSGGTQVRGAVTYNVDYDLTFQPQPDFCVTGGTVTAKRLWAQVPDLPDDEVDPAEFADASVQLTWQGCGSMNVAWGTTP